MYAKANLLAVPKGEALLLPKRYSMDELGMDEEDYARYRHPTHTPLALHRNAKGGRLGWVGFVNHGHPIPDLVGALIRSKAQPAPSARNGARAPARHGAAAARAASRSMRKVDSPREGGPGDTHMRVGRPRLRIASPERAHARPTR